MTKIEYIFKRNHLYTLESNRGLIFKGRVINRRYGLCPALGGKDGNGKSCHLNFVAAQNWKVIKVEKRQ